jgi:AmpD protein
MKERFEINTDAGILLGADYIPSPNQDERPSRCSPDLIVIHCISLPHGEFGGDHVSRLFLNKLDPNLHPDYTEIVATPVSAHLFIRRTGAVIQFVPFHRRAWHAGQSVFAGRPACNDYSLGIELEGTDQTSFTADQYDVLGAVIPRLCAAYSTLSADRVTGHSAIAPGRKTDPGDGFDWERLRDLIQPKARNT